MAEGSPYALTLQVKYAGSEYSIAGELNFDVEIFNPCADPAELIAPVQ